MLKRKTPKNDTLTHIIQDNCPVCGTYEPDGNVCKECLKQHELYEPQIEYIEY